MKNTTLSSNAIKELIAIAVVNGFFLYLFTEIDMLELLVEFAEDHENWELDEVIPLFFTLAISFIIFAYRRWKETLTLYNTAHNLSIRDPLTGLYNRRFFSEALQNEIAISKRNSNRFTVMLIDLDDFKSINDSLGHDIGDEVLIRFSQMLMNEMRESDIAARWGGEEFIILCRNTDDGDAHIISDKLLRAFRNQLYAEGLNVTGTLGVATSDGTESLELVIKKADDRLYEGKTHGKNQAVFA